MQLPICAGMKLCSVRHSSDSLLMFSMWSLTDLKNGGCTELKKKDSCDYLLKASNNHVLDDFGNLTNCFGLRNLINKPIRVTKETHTLMDHLYTNDSKHRMNSGICLLDISDHYHISCVVCVSKFLHRVPQGSTSVPLLFMVNVNDLPLVSNFKTILYADDTVLSLSANSMHESTTKINQELENMDNQLKYNKLSLNYSKTQYMLFTKQKNRYRHKFQMFKLTTICLQELNVSSALESKLMINWIGNLI